MIKMLSFVMFFIAATCQPQLASGCEIGEELLEVSIQYSEGFWFPQTKQIEPNDYRDVVGPSDGYLDGEARCAESNVRFRINARNVDGPVDRVNKQVLAREITLEEFRGLEVYKMTIHGQRHPHLNFKICSPPSSYQRDETVSFFRHDFICSINDFQVDLKMNWNPLGSDEGFCSIIGITTRKSENYYVNVILRDLCAYEDIDKNFAILFNIFQKLEIVEASYE